MRTIETEALILATSDHGESDRLITFFTRSNGKLKGIAKGARRSHRRFVHSFEPLSLVVLQMRERSPVSLLWVEACKLLEPHMALRNAVDRWGFAALLAEVVVELLPERQPQEDLFVLLKDALTHLEMDRDASNTLILSLFRLLTVLGYIPDLATCSHCGQPLDKVGRYWIHLARGRIVCDGHQGQVRGSVRLDLGTLVLLRRAREVEFDRLWRLRLRPADQASLLDNLIEVVRFQLGRELKSGKFLRGIGAL